MSVFLAFTFFALSILNGVSGVAPIVSQKETDKPRTSSNAECEDTRTLMEDVTFVLDWYEPAYTRSNWNLNIRDVWNEGHVHFEWTPINGASSIATVDMLVWPCGYTDEDLDNYYSQETLDTLVSTWESSTLTAQCIVDGVRIYEFDLNQNDTAYKGRFWISEAGETRVIQGYMAVPQEDSLLLEEYADWLYPETQKCS